MNSHRYQIAALLAFSIPLFFAGLAEAGLRGTDELRYGKIAKELEPGRDLFLLHFNGQRYTDKPPFFFWMLRGSFEALGGISPLASRLPGALSGIASVLICYFLAFGLLRDRQLALLSALTFMVMPRFIWIARWVRLDTPMAMFAQAAMLCFVVNYFDRRPRLTGWAFWALLAFSFAIKGPAGPAVVLGGILTFLLFEKQLRRAGELLHWGGIALFIGLNLAWALPVYLLGDKAASNDLIVGQTLNRIIDPDRHVGPPWYYAENLWSDAFPAMLLILVAGIYAWRNRRRTVAADGAGEGLWEERRSARRLLASWAGFTLLMFSLYPPKRGQYLLPAYPAAAILAVHFLSVLDERLTAVDDPRRKGLVRMFKIPLWVSFVPIALATLLILWFQILAPAVVEVTGRFSEDAAFDLQERIAEFEFGAYPVGWALRLGGSLFAFGTAAYFASRIARRRPLEAHAALVVSAWFFFLLLFGRVMASSVDDTELRDYAREFAGKLQERPELRICVYGEDKPFYNIYGDFHVEYFDKDYDDDFVAYTEDLHRRGLPLLVVVEADREKKIRRASWYEGMSRRSATVDGEEITILESPPEGTEPSPGAARS